MSGAAHHGRSQVGATHALADLCTKPGNIHAVVVGRDSRHVHRRSDKRVKVIPGHLTGATVQYLEILSSLLVAADDLAFLAVLPGNQVCMFHSMGRFSLTVVAEKQSEYTREVVVVDLYVNVEQKRIIYQL